MSGHGDSTGLWIRANYRPWTHRCPGRWAGWRDSDVAIGWRRGEGSDAMRCMRATQSVRMGFRYGGSWIMSTGVCWTSLDGWERRAVWLGLDGRWGVAGGGHGGRTLVSGVFAHTVAHAASRASARWLS